MKTLKANDSEIVETAVKVLKNGGLVIFPTETMYGIGADATNEKAINKLNNYKKRPLGKPYSIAVTGQAMSEEYAQLNKTARQLYKSFLPGPVTIISKIKIQDSNQIQKSKFKLASGIGSELGTIGIRIPDYPLVLDIIEKLGRPITATSANASYKKRPYKISDIFDNISDKQKSLIDLVIDAGELPHNEPSTVIDTTLDDPVVLRQGEVVIGSSPKVISRSEEDTKNTAKELWQSYEKHAGQRAIVFALEGPMGAGKTVFTKGLAKAMGIGDEILSPTYNLHHNYQFLIYNLQTNSNNQIPNIKTLSHIDAWRMSGPKELEALGMRGLIHDKSVLAIEWAERVGDTIRNYNEEAIIIWVKIKYGKKEKEREISWGAI
ncbi:MAG: Protein Sua5 [Candidatus Amesbacteria bacterium GW2011_GWB1_47_19]|nr:MAG: Protein Sua5 [Candidatus Amesbacteria bacterium GW2011_GWA1_44_24]KKU32112.1 MAG: hypothetical protein UX46_C0001G0099 [Candidatus Amesbacteria bacterium GW2011_GWC1_46_24]KKU67796.1 MAG: Protein Sua5 [Candidatus Amesbacteria bacterium GW2011_GWB1_47_19]OGD06018.1 MAG: hypothetical protein A2379_02910 [Candidatus Amesbacteria bacterium RIFOXYB1_FULL_47_13]